MMSRICFAIFAGLVQQRVDVAAWSASSLGWHVSQSALTRRKIVMRSATVKELRDQCRAKGLLVSGRKAELEQRLGLSNETPTKASRSATTTAPASAAADLKNQIDAEELAASSIGPAATDIQTVPSAADSSHSGVAEVVRIFELVESVVEKEGSPLPKQIAAAKPLLLRRSTYDAALATRRAYVSETFEEGPMAVKMARRVEMAHALLSAFASHERKRASKDTVRTILNAAVDSPAGPLSSLDACMQQLADDGTLDNDLLAYLTSLVEAEARKCGLPPPPLGGPLTEDSASSVDPSGKQTDGVATTDSMTLASGRAGARSPLLSVLEIVRRRVAVEMQLTVEPEKNPPGSETEDRSASTAPTIEGLGAGRTQMLKILAQASAIAEDDARLKYLESVLVSRQGARSFVRFAEDGAAYLTEEAEKLVQKELFDPAGEAGSEFKGQDQGLDAASAGKVRQAGRVRATALQARALLAKLP